jgi:transcriptional regulator with XRE-family HTH domain
MSTGAKLLREARQLSGITQRALAIRAGTKQSTISRLESGVEEPTLERLERLLLVMGFRLELGLERLELPIPRDDLIAARRMTAEERFRESASWNKLATTVELAAADARRNG